MLEEKKSQSFEEASLIQAQELLQRDGNLQPIIFVFGKKDGKDCNVLAPLIINEDIDKKEFMKQVGKTLYNKGFRVEKVAMISECWFLDEDSKNKIDDEIKNKIKSQLEEFGSVSKCPDKKEAILACSKSLDGTQTFAMQAFKRIDNKFVFEEMHIKEDKGDESQMYLLDSFWQGHLIYGA